MFKGHESNSELPSWHTTAGQPESYKLPSVTTKSVGMRIEYQNEQLKLCECLEIASIEELSIELPVNFEEKLFQIDVILYDEKGRSSTYFISVLVNEKKLVTEPTETIEEEIPIVPDVTVDIEVEVVLEPSIVLE